MSGMQVQNLNGVNVYNLASGKTLPQWMKDKGRKALSKDDDYRRRVELLQDFNFGTASQCIEISPDGNFVAVTGTYPPSFKVYELSQVSMKFERRCDEEVCAMKILSDDWTKIALLLADRTVAFHASYGIHHTMRIPQPGRSMVYDSTNCDLVVGGSSQDVYRLNLDKGCMMEPYRVQSESVNAVALNPAHPLLGCAGDDGVVECFDSRASNKICVGRYDVGAMMARRGMDGLGINQHHISCSSLQFHRDGLTMGVGTNNGYCMLFDLRATAPKLVKEHQYGLPVNNIEFHNSSNNVISTDAKVIKMWNKSSGEIFANIEPPADVNDIAVVQVDRFSYCMCTCMCFVRAYDGMRSDIVRCCAGREGRDRHDPGRVRAGALHVLLHPAAGPRPPLVLLPRRAH
jgi:ribosome biogenesis protein ENP2